MKYILTLFVLLISNTLSITAQVISQEEKYYRQERVRELEAFKYVATKDKTIHPAYIKEFKKPTEILKKGEELYRQIKDYCEKHSNLDKSSTVKELFENFNIKEYISPSRPTSSKDEKIHNITVIKGPLGYDLDNVRIDNDFDFQVSNIKQLEPYVNKINYIIYLVLNQFSCYTIFISEDSITSTKAMPYTPYLLSGVGIRDLVLFSDILFVPSQKAMLGAPKNSFVNMRNNRYLSSKMEQLSFEINFPDYRNIKCQNNILTKNNDSLFIYSSNLYRKRIGIWNPPIMFYSDQSTIYPPYGPEHNRKMEDMKILPTAFFRKVYNVFGKKRYKELVKNNEKLMIWFHCKYATSYANPVLIGTYENSILDKDEIHNLIKEFTNWKNEDFWDNNPNGVNKMIINLSRFPNIFDDKK